MEWFVKRGKISTQILKYSYYHPWPQTLRQTLSCWVALRYFQDYPSAKEIFHRLQQNENQRTLPRYRLRLPQCSRFCWSWLPYFSPQHRHSLKIGNLHDRRHKEPVNIRRTGETWNFEEGSCHHHAWLYHSLDLYGRIRWMDTFFVLTPKKSWTHHHLARSHEQKGYYLRIFQFSNISLTIRNLNLMKMESSSTTFRYLERNSSSRKRKRKSTLKFQTVLWQITFVFPSLSASTNVICKWAF